MRAPARKGSFARTFAGARILAAAIVIPRQLHYALG